MNVNSSHIESAEYSSVKQVLTVTFKGGKAYEYHQVPIHKWEAFQMAESKGSFLAEHIKPHHRVWPKADSKAKKTSSE